MVSLVVLIGGTSYTVATFANSASNASAVPLLPNAPAYVCLGGMPASECAQLKLTCGNAIIDPGEQCNNCAFDAGCPSGLVCGNVDGGENYVCHYPAGLCLAGPND